MVCTDRGDRACRQNQRIAPTLQRDIEYDPVRCARKPSPQHCGLQKCGSRSPFWSRSHERNGRQAHGAPNSRHEPSSDGVGDETYQISETESPYHEAANSCGERTDHECTGHRNEQRQPVPNRRARDQSHDDHERWSQACDRTRIATRQRDDQAANEVPEQDHADALGRIGCQFAGKDEASEGNLGNEQSETGCESR